MKNGGKKTKNLLDTLGPQLDLMTITYQKIKFKDLSATI